MQTQITQTNMLPNNKTRKMPLQRTAALLCAALAACGLAGRASAQVTGPLVAPYTSPPVPTPYQWQNYHSGGAPVPVTQFSVAAAAALGLTPLIDPLQGQLQGTPAELYNGAITQIPSFDIGNYLPTSPPGGLTGSGSSLINSYYPNHFADGTTFQWAAPFDFIPQTFGQVTADDSQPPPTAPTATAAGVSGFTASSTFTSVTAPGAATAGNDVSPAAENATNEEYLRLAAGVNGSAIWTLEEPDAGNYSLYLHIPSDLPDSAGNAEPRDTQVVYEIQVLDASGNVTTTTTATASQTEANDSQFLAGPFQVAANGVVVVTLTRSSALNHNADYLVADSMTLQATIGDVQSSPTVITQTSYPADFARAQYWGIYVPASVSANTLSTSTSPATAALQNADPDTSDGLQDTTATIVLKTGIVPAGYDPTLGGVAPAGYDPTRLIRQLVYFGRSDPSATVTTTLDDSNAGFSGTGTTVADTTGTASNGEYRASAATPGTTPATVVATWTVPVPAAGAGSSFFVYAHIPATPTGQTRLSQVFYKVTINMGTTAAPILTSYLATISQVTQGSDALVALPTGALEPAAGTSVIVQMYNQNGTTGVSPTSTVVVADSVNVSTGTGQGAIYCVDGFTGGVLWRFETPGSANGASAPVFASPAIARINVVITPPIYDANGNVTTPAVYQNKLVVIVGDNNGLVYCLDAIGNGDGTSNAAVLNQTTFQPNTVPQPAYGAPVAGTTYAPLVAGTAYAAAAATAHVGTTPVYWIYRPDVNSPKYVTGAAIGTVKPIDPTTDLPVPAAFNTASPNIFVDPSVPTGVVTTANPAPAAPTASNSIVYIGNSNGVLYALDGGGAPIDGATAATFTATGDTFNASQTGAVFDVSAAGANTFPLTAVVPTTQTLWWFSLRGVGPNSADNTSSADIESAAAVYVHTLATAVAVPPVGTQTATPRTTVYQPTVYIGSAHEMESTSNVGRLYALNGLYGPAGDSGQISPLTQPNPAAANYTGPGSFNYNVGQRPALSGTDTSDWTFPDAYGTYKIGTATVPGQSYNSSGGNGGARPALGNITGSPVVFTNIDETATNLNPDLSPRQTRIYIAANSGYESTTATPVPTARPDATTTGRIWAVNLDGSVGTTTNTNAAPKALNNSVWAYPLAFDPNDAGKDDSPQPDSPMGSFLRATPAIGFVQFPTTIVIADTNGAGAQGSYAPADAVHTPINGQSVPMLYLGTEGVNDTALYAVDIDGAMTSDNEGTTPAAATDTRTIYREPSPDGSVFQSSVALVTNATNPQTNPPGPGNGGDIFAVAGDTLYEYGATPISNPETSAVNSGANEDFPLIREDVALVSFGPISSPAIAGANVEDLVNIANPTGPGTSSQNFQTYPTDTTDWVIVGDSSSGLCRGVTPQDVTDGGIPLALGRVVPPNPNPAGAALLNALMQTFLVPTLANVSSTQAQPVGANTSLSVYDWGESVYACFTNVAPPNPANNPSLYVYDHTQYPNGPVAGTTPFYSSDGSAAQTVTFNLSDADTTTTSPLLLDNGSVNPAFLSTATLNAASTASSALNGYATDTGTLPASFASVAPFVQNLQTSSNTRYLGIYTYTIADGTARNNTPGARRRFLNVKQNVTEYTYEGTNSYLLVGPAVITGDATGNNLVSVAQAPTAAAPNGSYSFEKIPAIDQPTFGILNPLAVRGGGVPLGGSSAVPLGDEAGPFRAVDTSQSALPTQASPGSGDRLGMQALTNGNDVLSYAPSSTTGVGASPIARPVTGNDPAGITAGTTTAVVVTTTAEIPHNTTGGNQEPTGTNPPTGVYSTSSDGLQGGYGGYALDVFDRGALFNLGQSLRLKMTVPTNTLFAPAAGKDGIYWNSNFSNDGPNQNVVANQNPDTTGHSSVVNFLPWETPPTPYQIGGANGSQDYPDIAPGNITQTLQPVTIAAIGNAPAVSNSPGDLTSNNITLTPATGPTGVKSRTVYGNPINIQIAVPNHQPANQQLYQQGLVQYTQANGGFAYAAAGQIAPVTEAGVSQINAGEAAFPMGYVTSKRLYVPNANGFYSAQRPYRDVRVYTGVPVDMRTSITAASATTDIGKAPAAFGVQTENDPTYGLFTPYGSLASGAYQQSPFQTFFKPLEIHNDGNVNLLNVHLNQKMSVAGLPPTLPLYSDANDPLSYLLGYDVTGVTGPRTADLMQTQIVEQPFLIRSSVDTDLAAAYGRNPYLAGNATYPGATFHKPVVGSDQPSTLMVPDAPDRYVPGASPGSPNFLVSPSSFPVMPNNGVTYQAPPYVSLAFPFGTPVGTYHTAAPQDMNSLRLFEGLDTAAANGYNPNTANYLLPPVYGGAIGGYYGQNYNGPTPRYNQATGEILDSSQTPQPEDAYNGKQPISTTGTQLIGQVTEQRLTDGATYGAVPMIDAGPAGTNAQGSANGLSYPDFAPAAFRDPATGNLSVYWTSGRSNNSFGIFGANLPFTLPSAASSAGYFLPNTPPTAANPTGDWWTLFSPAVQTGAVNSGLSITQAAPGSPVYGFDVAVSNAANTPYSNTLYSYTVSPTTGALTALGAVTPPASSTQVKYGVHGLYTGAAFSSTPNTPSLWAFWTASARGRTAIYYNSFSNGTWLPAATAGAAAPSTVALLPVPAGLTAVSDVSPLLMPDAPVNGVYGSVIEATYSGTSPDGSISLYTSRYLPDATTKSQLDLAAFPPVTENLKAAAGWYQARDVAWSRTGALNVSVIYPTPNGPVTQFLLYQGTNNVPQFTNAIYDKTSGLLVLTGVKVPIISPLASPPLTTTNTVYVDAATGRIRFSPALLPSQNFTQIQATFSPQARRLTTDSRANTASVTFMDTAQKTNDDPNRSAVEADRRWVIWRKAGIAGNPGTAATLYFKTQRLTLCLPYPINVTSTQSGNPPAVTNTVNLTSVTLNGVDVTNKVDVDYAQGRIYFPLSLNAEGQTATATYIEAGTVTVAAPNGVTETTPANDTVQWQDEPLVNNNDALPAGTAAGLDAVIDNAVPIDNAANENNAAAFLDPFASATTSHKVWLFWNSTRNGTADIYSETIDPRFAPAAQ